MRRRCSSSPCRSQQLPTPDRIDGPGIELEQCPFFLGESCCAWFGRGLRALVPKSPVSRRWCVSIVPPVRLFRPRAHGMAQHVIRATRRSSSKLLFYGFESHIGWVRIPSNNFVMSHHDQFFLLDHPTTYYPISPLPIIQYSVQ